MQVKFGKIQRPRKIVVDEATMSLNFARFVAEPFERVIGHSIGNALRRILLSSLEAPGIISIRIEGVPHEFMSVEGIAEDVTNIILNVKNAKLRCLPSDEAGIQRESRIVSTVLDITQDMIDKSSGQYDVTLGDLIKNTFFEVVNPDLHIFSVTKPCKRQIDFRIGFGRGYVPSERHVIPSKLVDEIVLDTAFSPVVMVNYFVENTRVGQDTDFDRLVLEVTTDGRLTPIEALSFAAQVAQANFEVFTTVKAPTLTFANDAADGRSAEDELIDKLCLRIDEIELSVRSTNCLASANIDTIAELVCIPERKMLDFRNFGKKSLNEIKAKLHEMGLELGMDLSALGISTDNVKDRIVELHEGRKAKREMRDKK